MKIVNFSGKTKERGATPFFCIHFSEFRVKFALSETFDKEFCNDKMNVAFAENMEAFLRPYYTINRGQIGGRIEKFLKILEQFDVFYYSTFVLVDCGTLKSDSPAEFFLRHSTLYS